MPKLNAPIEAVDMTSEARDTHIPKLTRSAKNFTMKVPLNTPAGEVEGDYACECGAGAGVGINPPNKRYLTIDIGLFPYFTHVHRIYLPQIYP